MTRPGRALACASGLMMALALAAPAAAQSAGNDIVVLRNGGRVRGTVMEQDPARGVAIQLADGTTRRLDAAEVADVQYAAAPAAPPPPPAIAPVAPAAAPGELSAPLHVEVAATAPPVLLQRRLASFEAAGTYTRISGAEWADVCTSPCDAPVPRNVVLRAGGLNVVASAPFILRPDVSQIRISPGNPGGYISGLLLGSAGVAALIVGGTLALVGGTSRYSQGMVIPGIITASIGLPLTIVGFVIMGLNFTRVTDPGGRALSRRGGPRWSPAGLVF